MTACEQVLQAALALADCGLPIFPVYEPGRNGSRCSCGKPQCDSPAKHPRIRNGLKAASTSAGTIRDWFQQWPQANVGLRTGAESGVFVLDVDPGHGGSASLAELAAGYGPLPITVESLTGGGGRHLLFRHPGRRIPNRIGVLPGLDVRGDGGYIVAPPSVHVTGASYAWREGRGPREIEVAEAPPWLLEKIASEPTEGNRAGSSRGPTDRSSSNSGAGRSDLRRRAEAYLAKVAGVGEGARNSEAFRLAGHLAALVDREGIERLAPGEILHLMETWNARNLPPLGDVELREAVHSGQCNGTPRADKPPRERSEWNGRSHGSADAPTDSDHLPLSDIGNAERLVRRHGVDLRFVAPWGWLVWDGARWRIDEERRVELLAKSTVRSILDEAKDSGLGEEARKRIASHAIRSESDARIRAMLSRARPELPASVTAFDANPWLLNVENGTLNLRTGEVLAHRREDFISKLAPVVFEPEARSEDLERFLDHVTAGDPEFRSYLMRALGYSIAGDAREDAVFLLDGPGNSGKTTFLEAAGSMLGEYAKVVPFEVLLARERTGGGGPRPELAQCAGARIVTAAEVEEGRRFHAATLKALAGGDRLLVASKYKDPFVLPSGFKLWLAANHPPRLDPRDSGARRRLVLIPFSRAIERPDTDLRRRLQEPEARKALLARAVHGGLQWLASGLGTCARVEEATARYWGEQGPKEDIATFVEECCVRDERARTPFSALYAAFQEFRESRGLDPVSLQAFGRTLGDMGFQHDRTGASRLRRGLRLRPSGRDG